MKEVIKNDLLRQVLSKPFGWDIGTQNMLTSSSNSNNDGEAITVVDEDLCQRAGRRLVAEELNKQQNLEDVVQRADKILQSEKVEADGSERTDQGWVDECLDGAGKAYNEDLKDYWAKLLAGEIKHPGTYSLRAIDFMKKLSKKDAELIKLMCRYVLYTLDKRDAFILRYEDSPISYSDLSFLMELRLIDSSNFVVKQYRFGNDNGGAALFFHGNCGLAVIMKKKKYDLPIYSFTQLGKEILTIVDEHNTDFEYLKGFAKDQVNKNASLEIYGGELETINNTTNIVRNELFFQYPEEVKEETK